MLHVNDDEVVAGEAGDLGEGGGEAEEEEAIKGFAIVEAGLEGLGRGGDGNGGGWDGGGGQIGGGSG